MTITNDRPVVLCVGGHDPSGGAGILADSESIQAAKAFAVTVISASTEQDSCGLHRISPHPPDYVEAQCRRLIDDSRPRVLKIGLLGSSGIVRVLARLIDEAPDRQVVIDPVLASGTGHQLVDAALLNQLRQHLLHRCTLITPNLPEAQTLTDGRNPDECAARLMSAGTRWVLVTGTHDSTEEVVNRLYGANGVRQVWRWPRLAGEYHGSGCTLASAVAARLAWGMAMEEAVASAQEYTWGALQHAFRSGRCQLTPNRFYHFAARDEP